MNEYPKPLTNHCLTKILDQMNNSLYKVNEKGGEFLPIKDEKEWKVVETILESIQEETKKAGQ